MLKRIHMQDQVNNRIAELMNEAPIKHHDWDEIFQNAATFTFVVLLITLGVSW